MCEDEGKALSSPPWQGDSACILISKQPGAAPSEQPMSTIVPQPRWGGEELGKYGMEEVELHGLFPTLSPNCGLAPSTAKQRAGGPYFH